MGTLPCRMQTYFCSPAFMSGTLICPVTKSDEFQWLLHTYKIHLLCKSPRESLTMWQLKVAASESWMRRGRIPGTGETHDIHVLHIEHVEQYVLHVYLSAVWRSSNVSTKTAHICSGAVSSAVAIEAGIHSSFHSPLMTLSATWRFLASSTGHSTAFSNERWQAIWGEGRDFWRLPPSFRRAVAPDTQASVSGVIRS